MFAMLLLELKKNLQDKGLLFWMILLPIIFTVLFIAVFTSGVDEATKQTITTSIVPGYTVMFVFFIIISMVSSFLKDRDLGMVARLASTPLTSHSYLLGKWIPYMIIVWIQIAILLIFGKIVYHVPLEQPILILILSVILAFTTTGIGLFCALIVQTENMGIAITQIIALGGAFLGGLWVPLEMMPSFLQGIAKTLPQYWGHLGFREAMTGTLEMQEFFQVVFILFAFGCGSFILSVVLYPKFLQKARG